MNDTEKRAGDHFRRSEWAKALECFEKLLAASQNNKNGNYVFPKEKLVEFLIGRSECNLALGRTDFVTQDCRRALKLFVEGSNEVNGCNRDRARRLLSDTRKILDQVKNRFENQGQRGQCISAQKLEEDLIALDASMNDETKNGVAQDRIIMAEDPRMGKNTTSEFHCSYCSLFFPDSASLRSHCMTGSHQTIIMSDEGRDWKYRPPPRYSNFLF